MKSIVSVDVEALPFRAETDHVERLIYGKIHDGEYGIKRLCHIFNEHSVKGVFMIDFAETKLYGDDVFKRITNDILSAGHDVELHYHSEIHFNDKDKFFKNLIISDAKEALEYGCEKFHKIVGKSPYVFRAGGFLINRQTLIAAKACGIKASTNLVPKFKIHSDVLSLPQESTIHDAFKWSNGVIEICVDVPIPELSNATMKADDNTGFSYIEHVLKNKPIGGLINIVLHSWSLLQRNPEGYHDNYLPEYEDNLRQLLSMLREKTTTSTYTDISDTYKPERSLQTIDLSYLKSYTNDFIETVEKDGQIFIEKIDPTIDNVKCRLNIPGPCEIKISSDVCGGSSLNDKALLLAFEFDTAIHNHDTLGFYLSDRKDIGLYRYIDTGPGYVTGSFTVSIPLGSVLSNIKIIKWYPNDSVTLKRLILKKDHVISKDKDIYASPGKSSYSYAVTHLPPSKISEGRLSIHSFRNQLPVLLKLYDISNSDYYGLLSIGNIIIPFVSSRHEITVLWSRREINSSMVTDLAACFFNELPETSNILIENVFLEGRHDDTSDNIRLTSSTFVLQPNGTFGEYVGSISKSLIYDIRRESNRLSEQFPELDYVFYQHSNITASLLNDAGKLIRSHLLFKINSDNTKDLEWDPLTSFILNADNYKKNGLIAVINTKDHVLAAAVLLLDGDTAHLIAAGNLDNVTKYSLGKILMLRLIERLINNGFRKIIMGGGDFGYKTRFGAKALPLHSIKISRNHKDRHTYGSASICTSKFVDYSDHHLETVVGLDLNKMVERDVLGFPENFNRYQSSTNEAFKKLISYIPYNSNHTFLDVGSGKGKVLIYASLLGYHKLIGIEYSKELQDIATRNFHKLSLASDIKLVTCDASCVDPDLLNEVDVVFLYNPFGREILNEFLHQLRLCLTTNPAKGIYLIYLNDVYRELFIDSNCTLIKRFERDATGNNFDSSSIYYFKYHVNTNQ